MLRLPPSSPLFPYTTLFRSGESLLATLVASWRLFSALRVPAFDHVILAKSGFDRHGLALARRLRPRGIIGFAPPGLARSEEHTSELQSLRHLECVLLLEKKN